MFCLNAGCFIEDELAATDGGGLAGSSSGGPRGGSDGESGLFVGMTAAHNATRADLAPGVSLPDLSWSQELADFAQEWSDALASRCGVIEHRVQRSYGENIALRGSTRMLEPFSAEEAVAGWAAEEACWDFGTIRGSEQCDATCTDAINSNGCGHYTQLVWRDTERVGCGYSTCDADRLTFEIWVCNYDPPGNFVGQAPY